MRVQYLRVADSKVATQLTLMFHRNKKVRITALGNPNKAGVWQIAIAIGTLQGRL
jgi:hypothetical protein